MSVTYLIVHTVQDQLLAMSVQQEGGEDDSNPVQNSRGLRSAEDELCAAILQSSTECFEAAASRILRSCNTAEVQNVTTKLHKFLR